MYQIKHKRGSHVNKKQMNMSTGIAGKERVSCHTKQNFYIYQNRIPLGQEYLMPQNV